MGIEEREGGKVVELGEIFAIPPSPLCVCEEASWSAPEMACQALLRGRGGPPPNTFALVAPSFDSCDP